MSSATSPNNTKRALVTGATSHLGDLLVRRLLMDGVDVHCLARPSSDLSALEATDAVLHRYDGSADHMSMIVKTAAPDFVYHLASCYLRTHKPAQIHDLIASNISFGTQVLDALTEQGVCRFINASSYFQYLVGPDYNPVNLYAATKQAFQNILTYYREAHGLNTTTLILFDIYSQGDPRPKLMTGLRDALKNGSPQPLPNSDVKIDLVHADDVVDALVFCANTDVGIGPYAVSSGRRYSFREIISVFEDVGQKPIDCQWGGFTLAPRTPLEPWSGPALPGWSAQIDLQDGIKRLLREDADNAP